jgi:methyl-accepting chemotaxis protein
MNSTGVAGFWSYTHRDNEADGGRLLRLAQHVQAEYELLTGQEIQIFIDRDDIAWGDQWRTRINNALQATTFFIAIVTPRFLQSTECRRELLQFSGEARSLGLQELLLPVLYAPVASLEEGENSGDEIVALLSRTQRVDWTQLRLLDEQSAEYRQAINRLASRLAEISDGIQNNPQNLPEIGAAVDSTEDLEAPGIVDLLAVAEQTYPRWGETVEEIARCLNELEKIANPYAERMQKNDRAGHGFKGRLTLIRQFSMDIDPVAEKMLELGSSYTSDLIKIDPAMLTLARMATDATEEADTDGVREFFAIARQLAQSSAEAVAEMRVLSDTLTEVGRTSRDLRKITQKISTALRSMIDGQSIIDEWIRRIDEIDDGPQGK